MKKVNLFFLVILWGLNVESSTAQPVFTSADCFRVFDYGTIGVVTVPQNYSAYIPLTGPSYTWNFNTGGITGPWASIAAPSEPYSFRPGSYSPVFPLQGSEINEYAPMQFGRDVFYSYSDDDDTLYYEGQFTAGTVMAVYPPVPYLTFPLSYGDSVITVNYIHAQVNAVAGIWRTHRYDGYGNIRLPYDTVTNVYRIRTLQIDSAFVNPPSATVTEEIIWFQASTGLPVFRLLKSPSGFFAYYAMAAPNSGLSSVDGSGFLVYPVPFHTDLNISTPADFRLNSIRLYDTGGRLVWNGEASGSQVRLGLQDLSPGCYRLVLTSVEGRLMSRNVIRMSHY